MLFIHSRFSSQAAIFSAITAAALAMSLGGCLGQVDEEGVTDDFASGTNDWADRDTDGVGTHRITGSAVNVRGDELSQVQFVSSQNDLLALTYETQEYNGYTYYEAYFKSGTGAGQRGWVAKDFLAYSELRTCNASAINVRTGGTLDTIVGTVGGGSRAYVTSGTIRNTGTYRYFEVSVDGVRGFVATAFLCSGGGGSDAERILGAHNARDLTLWDQTFGRFDGADPLSNIRDAAAGRAAKTSCYGTAPCNRVTLKDGLLGGMASLAEDYGFNYFVTSIAGASHSRTSYHYQGRAVDIGTVNGVFISGNSSTAQAFMDACRALGAIEVLGPSNDPNHQDHIHCAW